MRWITLGWTLGFLTLAAPAPAASMSAGCDGLQAALDQATGGDVITLAEDCAGDTFELRGDRAPGDDTPYTLQGGEPDAGTTLDGEDEVQLLLGSDTGAVVIRNLTFRDGFADEDDGGAIEIHGDSAPAIGDGNVFTGNEAQGDGGAVYVEAFGPVTVSGGNVFEDNRGATGGAVSIVNGSRDVLQRGVVGRPITVSDNTFRRNRASGGGGGGAVSVEDDAGGTIAMRGNTFGGDGQGNSAFAGGAVAAFSTSSAEIADNTFDENAGVFAGGGLLLQTFASAALTDNAFGDNRSGFFGGGAFVVSCEGATIAANAFDDNRLDLSEFEARARGREKGFLAQIGAGLYLQRSCGSNGPESGGDVRGDGGAEVVQNDNRIRGNRMTGAVFGQFQRVGAGAAISGFSVHSTNDRYVRNVIEGGAEAIGGGLAFDSDGSAPFVARNLVAAGNRIESLPPDRRGSDGERGGSGGGLALFGSESEFRIEDSTIEANEAALGSGISGTSADRLVLDNSIVHGNESAEDEPEIDGFPQREVRSSDVCVDGAPHADVDGAPNSNICAAPALGGDAGDENVDQTAASPTVDRGENGLVDGDLAQDYAGGARIAGERVDMGADELAPPAVEPPPTTTTPAAPQGGVLGVQRRSCVSRRAFTIRIRVPRGEEVTSARVVVNGKRVRVVRGRRLRAPVVLRGLPRGRFTVRITLRLANGERLSGVRRYNTCIPRLPGDGPPRL